MQSIIIVTPEYKEGRQAWEENRPSNHNPHNTNTCEWSDWQKGWRDQEPEYEEIELTADDAHDAGYRAYETADKSGAEPEFVMEARWARWKSDYTRGWCEACGDASVFG